MYRIKANNTEVELHCKDAWEVIWEPNSIDLVVTSPPYNIGIKYDNSNDDMAQADYQNFLENTSYLISYILKDDAHAFVNLYTKPSTLDSLYRRNIKALSKHLKIQNVIAWVKSIAINNIQMGNYKPINSNKYLNNCWETIFHLVKNTCSFVDIDRKAIGVPYQDISNADRYQADGIHCGGDVWFINNKANISEEDARWLALFVDTEGSIYISKTVGKNPSPQMHLIVDFSNSNFDLIKRAKDLCGFGSITEREFTGNKRKMYRLTIAEKQAASLLSRIYPYLIVKNKQAILGLFYDSLKKKRNSPGFTLQLSEENLNLRLKSYDCMKMLNSYDYANCDLKWIPNFSDLECQDTWFLPYKNRNKKLEHPASFPIGLPTKCILLTNKPNHDMVICDPFMGSGTTIIAAINQEVKKVIGVDISEKYFTQTIERIKSEIGVDKIQEM